MYEFDLSINPVAQGRPRIVHQGGFVHAYDPQKSRLYKKRVASYIKQIFNDDLINVPVYIDYVFVRPFKKSFTKKQKQLAKDGKILPTTKPDVDNYIKSTQDALIGSVLKDDNVVVKTSAKKVYGSKGRVLINIEGMI